MPAATDTVITLDEPAIGSSSQPPSDHAAAVRALAAAEARRLLRSPLTLLGVALSLVSIFGNGWFDTRIADLSYADKGIGFILVPLLVATMFGTFLMATRSRRLDVDELERPTLLPASAITRAHLLAVAAPVALSVVVGAAWLIELVVWFDGYGTPDLIDLAHGPLLVALTGAAGVAVGTWTPVRVAPVLLLVAFAFPLTLAQTASPVRSFAWWREPQGWANPDLMWEPTIEHTVYLAGVAATLAVLAVLRHGLNPRRASIGLIAVVATVAGAVGQAQPPTDDELRARLALAQDPMSRADCEVRDTVEYCVWPEHRPLLDHWHEVLGAALAALPDAADRDVTVKVWLDPEDAGLRDALAATGTNPYLGYDLQGAFAPDDLTGAAGEIIEAIRAYSTTVVRPPKGHPDAISLEPGWVRGWAEPQVSFVVARDATARAVGFASTATYTTRPVEDWHIESWQRTGRWPGSDEGRPMPLLGDTLEAPTTCLSLGQARAAIAMWAAGTATPLTREYVTSYRTSAPAGADFSEPSQLAWDIANPFVWGNFGGIHVVGPSEIAWGKDELAVAAQLLARPVAEVRAALVADWDRWVDPATPTSELVEALGLTPPPTAAERLAAAGITQLPSQPVEGGGARLGPDGQVDPRHFTDPHAVPCA